MMVSESVRFYFDTYQAAAAGLLVVLLDARTTESTYRFTGLNASTIYTSGLYLEGEIEAVAAKVESIPGAVRQDE
jgi:hypothetical protein